jgi:hypothetical protein
MLCPPFDGKANQTDFSPVPCAHPYRYLPVIKIYYKIYFYGRILLGEKRKRRGKARYSPSWISKGDVQMPLNPLI